MYYEEDYHKVVRENEAVLKENAAQRETIASLRATISRLREYAWHKVECPHHVVERAGVKCKCGYDELIKELEETK